MCQVALTGGVSRGYLGGAGSFRQNGDTMHDVKRDQQLVDWISAAPAPEVLTHQEVMWGVCFNLDSIDAPEALFATEEAANAYVTLFDRAEWHVGPYAVVATGRNSVDIPEPVPAESP
jgi:hypothetical protein